MCVGLHPCIVCGEHVLFKNSVTVCLLTLHSVKHIETMLIGNGMYTNHYINSINCVCVCVCVCVAVHVLWWYEGADQRAASRHKAHGDPRVVAAGDTHTHTHTHTHTQSLLTLSMCLTLRLCVCVCVLFAVRESVTYLVSQQNKLMFPTPFSPSK